MAEKYHISPTTGRPNLCRASLKDCPVGGAHHASKEEAREAYEAAMKESTFASAVHRAEKKFKANDPVRSATVWAYDDIVAGAGGKKNLDSTHPKLTFRKGPNGELLVIGPYKKVRAYVEEPGGDPQDIATSLATLRRFSSRERRKKEESSPQKEAQVKKVSLPKSTVDPVVATATPLQEEYPWVDSLSPEDIDDDFSDIKCEDCGSALDNCSCGECLYCGGTDGYHYEDCTQSGSKPKAYSWD